MINPAIPEAIPPEICDTDELMLMNAPLSAGEGTDVMSAEEEIMRAVMPTNRIELMAMAAHKGVRPRLQYTKTKVSDSTVPTENTQMAPNLSAARPMSGPKIMEQMPVTR